MATVFTYWCLPEEEVDFLGYLSAWQIYAYPPSTFRNPSDVIPLPIQEILKLGSSQISFGPKGFLSDKDIGPRDIVNDVRHYGISPMQSNTITYRRPHLHENGGLGKANLSVYWKYPDDEAIVYVEKDIEFVKWAKKVFNWARKRASKKVMLNGYSYPATAKVKELVDKNSLLLGQ